MGEIIIVGSNIDASHGHIALSKRVYPHVQVGTIVRLLRNGEIMAEWRIVRESALDLIGDRVQLPQRQYADSIVADLLRYSEER